MRVERNIWLAGCLLASSCGLPAASAAEPVLAEFFKAETARLSARPLLGINSADEWKARRPELQRELREMLGLDPWPEKTDLQARVTGTVERPDFVVEKVVYQSSPGLYVTGNLFRPKTVSQPLPAILYVCGHSKVEKDGVIYGNKTHYQHHAAWYAANGYVCLIVDTLQLGELPGLHHGTYREGTWWWQSRGYTPAGGEAWNAVRGIDYLISRPEVDRTKIGVTGRSGGGATSWWVGAIDDRVAAVVPVAGITDLQNHVVDGVVEGHCDCMYPVNTYRWDFPVLAALVAPKPMLIENTDHDPIFPEAGVRRVYAQVQKVYGWYGASDKLGLVIGKGGHVDSTEIRHPSFAFFEKWLKGKDTKIDEPDRKVAIEDLKVLPPGEAPSDSKNARIQETFVPKAQTPPVPASKAEWEALRQRWIEALKSRVFAGWPEESETPPLNPQKAFDITRGTSRVRAYDFTSQPGITLRLWLFTPADEQPLKGVVLYATGEEGWTTAWSQAIAALGPGGNPDDCPDGVRTALRAAAVKRYALAIAAPRGIGPTAWPAKADVQVRRRFALLGETLDGMRVWDIRRALGVLRSLPEMADVPREIHGAGDAAAWALWAAAFEPEVKTINLERLPTTVRDGPAFLNLARVLEMPQAVALLYPRAVNLYHTSEAAWTWPRDLAQKLGATEPWPRVR